MRCRSPWTQILQKNKDQYRSGNDKAGDLPCLPPLLAGENAGQKSRAIPAAVLKIVIAFAILSSQFRRNAGEGDRSIT